LKSNQGDKKVHLQAPLPLWCFIGKEQAILLPYFLPRKQHYAQEHQDGEEKWQYFREFQAPITDNCKCSTKNKRVFGRLLF
jgi:hypothetical protein